MNVVLDIRRNIRLAEEGHVDETEHVERGESGGDPADDPEECAVLEGGAENCVLAEKSSEGRNSGDGQRGDEKCSRGGGNFVPERANLANVLLAGHGVDDTAGAEEEERFEKRVGH